MKAGEVPVPGTSGGVIMQVQRNGVEFLVVTFLSGQS